MVVADTCTIIWDALSPGKLSGKASRSLEEAAHKSSLIFCSISFWEIAMLIRLERLKVNTSYHKLMDLILASRNYLVKDISPAIAKLSVDLPSDINKDPADRIIAATAITEKAALVTADKNLRQSKSLQTIW